MTTQKNTPYQLFRKSFTLKYLQEIFESNIQEQKLRGIDRINAYQLSKSKKSYLK
ncbi:hypothetical protein H1P_3810003 [Hyella patelloides LEGE 07179]|uniref:Uncharacterized protein n=1 Tax=Hyella patelloides LEGE 07179 TaxID=945734 RepID=A0A563VWQ4_9CYAN|nr:hypothetical protein H1P_3810003 [Hyella patelloides LEGE 07179]